MQMAARSYFISLDFGTHASGFAFATLKGDPVTYWDWKSAPIPYPKNITTLLYECTPGKGFGKPKAWGWEARTQYMKMKPEEKSQHVYEENFKLSLASSTAEYSNVWQPNEDLPGSKLIADYLRELSTMAKEVVKQK